MKSSLNITVPLQQDLEKRFEFINDKTLRSNIALTFKYIIFLINLEDEYELPGTISYSIYKDIILHTAIVIESCIHHCLNQFISNGKVKESTILPSGWKYKSCKELYRISKQEVVVGAIRNKSNEKFSANTQFQTLNKAALKASIFNKDLYEKADTLRKQRNYIHLAALKEIDDLYGKEDIQEAFNYAEVIIKQIEDKLSELTDR